MKYTEMSLEQLNNEKNKLEENLKNLREEYKKITDKIIYNDSRLKTINELIDSKTLTLENTEELLNYFPETKARQELRNKYLCQWNLKGESYIPETNQVCIRIALERHNDKITELTHEGIIKLLPYIKQLKEGFKYIDISEHTLSECYSYCLQVYPDEFKVIARRFSRVYTIFSSKDLMETLKYIQKHHYYKEDED